MVFITLNRRDCLEARANECVSGCKNISIQYTDNHWCDLPIWTLKDEYICVGNKEASCVPQKIPDQPEYNIVLRANSDEDKCVNVCYHAKLSGMCSCGRILYPRPFSSLHRDCGRKGWGERERERGNENKKTTERRKRSECGRDDEYPICSQAHR